MDKCLISRGQKNYWGILELKFHTQVTTGMLNMLYLGKGKLCPNW